MEELEKTEWKIQTESPSMDEEKKLVEHVKSLETQLAYYRKEEAAQNQINKLNNHMQYDVVVCQDWAGILTSQSLWKQPIPLITTYHLPLAWDIGYYADLPCDFATQLEFYAMAQSDLIIAVSHAMKKHLEDSFTFTKGKIDVIHNGTNTSFFSPGIKSNQPILLYVGRFFEQKGFDLLPEIFYQLKRIHPNLFFKIIGVGPLKQEVVNKLKNLGLVKSFQIFDFAQQEKVLELYRESSIVIMPSRYEPFGLVAIESMATATPIVASDVGGLREIITHGEDGFLVAPNNVMGFVNIVSELLNNKQLTTEIGIRARKKIVRNFDQNLCYERTRNLFIDLIMDFKKKLIID